MPEGRACHAVAVREKGAQGEWLSYQVVLARLATWLGMLHSSGNVLLPSRGAGRRQRLCPAGQCPPVLSLPPACPCNFAYSPGEVGLGGPEGVGAWWTPQITTVWAAVWMKLECPFL